MKRKRVVVLGATGSIGESALKVAHDIPERMEIVGLAANSNAEKLAAAANTTRAKAICLVDERKIDILRTKLEYRPTRIARDRLPNECGHGVDRHRWDGRIASDTGRD